MFRTIPCDVQEPKWQEFVQDQLMEHRVARIREEIVNTAIGSVLEKYRFEKKPFEFSSQCVHVIWLRLFNWVLPRLDPYRKGDTSERTIGLMIDIEPRSSPIDCWMFGNVSQIFTQKSFPLHACISPLPSITTTKSTGNNHDDKTTGQQQRIKLKSIKVKKLERKYRKRRTSMVSSELKKSLEVGGQAKKISRYLKKNTCFTSLNEPSTVEDLPEKDKKGHRSNLEENKIDFLTKISKQTVSNSNSNRQQEVINIDRSTKSYKRNKKKDPLLEKETTMQFQRPSDRVEILYVILPEHGEQHLVSKSLNVKRTK